MPARNGRGADGAGAVCAERVGEMGTDRYTVHRQDNGTWAVVYRGEVYGYYKTQRAANNAAALLNDDLEQAKYARRHEGAKDT